MCCRWRSGIFCFELLTGIVLGRRDGSVDKVKLKPPFSRALTAEELAAMDDEDIDFSDIPELTEEWFAKARIVYPHEWRQRLTSKQVAGDNVVPIAKAKS